MRKMMIAALIVPVLALGLLLSGASKQQDASEASGLSGVVRVDGSSTVFPITEAVGEEFQMKHRDVRVTVGISGTGGGFKKFTVGETDINDASRPIKEKEATLAASNSIDYIELPVAFDGLSVMVNPANTWVDHLSIEELHKIWQPGSTVKTWKDVRPEWPDRPLVLYGPDVDSGTFDYFTEVVNGASQVSRSDYTASADDNVLVTGIAGDANALGYFGFAYYEENQDKLKLVPIDGGAGPVAPSRETINNGTYAPLSRPLFIYVSTKAVQRPEVQAFVQFYMDNAAQLSAEVGYVALPHEAYALGIKRFAARQAGSVFNSDAAKSGKYSIAQLLGM
ncbi:MAG: PstS family phosphate ABC transporter substrate-binding protein [Candidatus Krumholzibacteriia bacterium]